MSGDGKNSQKTYLKGRKLKTVSKLICCRILRQISFQKTEKQFLNMGFLTY